MDAIRVLLVDDHPILHSGLKSLIETQADLNIVGEAGDGAQALKLSEELNADVIVIDTSAHDLGGVEVTAKIKQDTSNSKILVVTAHEDPTYLRATLNAGASGYILKRAAAEDLCRAIRAVAQGSTYIDPTLAGQLVIDLNHKTIAPCGVSLSERECEVLRLVSQGHALKMIASQLDVGVRTIETYKTRGMEKLGLRSRADLVRYASEQGWLKSI